MAKEDGYSLEVIAPVDSMLLLDNYNTTREYLIHGELIVPGQDMYLGLCYWHSWSGKTLEEFMSLKMQRTTEKIKGRSIAIDELASREWVDAPAQPPLTFSASAAPLSLMAEVPKCK
jgi:hypothetical protein